MGEDRCNVPNTRMASINGSRRRSQQVIPRGHAAKTPQEGPL